MKSELVSHGTELRPLVGQKSEKLRLKSEFELKHLYCEDCSQVEFTW